MVEKSNERTVPPGGGPSFRRILLAEQEMFFLDIFFFQNMVRRVHYSTKYAFSLNCFKSQYNYHIQFTLFKYFCQCIYVHFIYLYNLLAKKSKNRHFRHFNLLFLNGFYLFAVKFMVNCQSIYNLSDLKIKNIYFILSNSFHIFANTCI